MRDFLEAVRCRFSGARSETRAAALGGTAVLILALAGIFGSAEEASADHGTGPCAGLAHGACTPWLGCTTECCNYLCDPPGVYNHRYCLPANQPCWEEKVCTCP